MDEHDNLKDHHQISWGDVTGKIIFDKGVNQDAVYFLEPSAAIDLRSDNSCLNHPSSCADGFSISFWLKYSCDRVASEGLRNTLLSVGSHEEESEGMQIVQVNRSYEHLGVSLRANHKQCMYVFNTVENVWMHVIITWHSATDLVIYVNGEKVNDFVTSGCIPKSLAQRSGHLVLRSGSNVHVGYDELAVWEHVITAEEIQSVYEYYYKGK